MEVRRIGDWPEGSVLPAQLVPTSRRLDNIADSCADADAFFAAALAQLHPLDEEDFDSAQASERGRVAARAVTRYGVDFREAWRRVGGEQIDALRSRSAR